MARSVADEVLPAHGVAASVAQAAKGWAKRNGYACRTTTLRGGREVRVMFIKETS